MLYFRLQQINICIIDNNLHIAYPKNKLTKILMKKLGIKTTRE